MHSSPADADADTADVAADGGRIGRDASLTAAFTSLVHVLRFRWFIDSSTGSLSTVFCWLTRHCLQSRERGDDSNIHMSHTHN